jgi:hypothetical protein
VSKLTPKALKDHPSYLDVDEDTETKPHPLQVRNLETPDITLHEKIYEDSARHTPLKMNEQKEFDTNIGQGNVDINLSKINETCVSFIPETRKQGF